MLGSKPLTLAADASPASAPVGAAYCRCCDSAPLLLLLPLARSDKLRAVVPLVRGRDMLGAAKAPKRPGLVLEAPGAACVGKLAVLPATVRPLSVSGRPALRMMLPRGAWREPMYTTSCLST